MSAAMRLRIRPFTAVAGVVLLAVALAACGSPSSTTPPMLCLATDFPTSGADAALGISAQNAVDLAVDQAEIGGAYTLTTLHFNSQSAKQGSTNMTDAATQSCTLAFIGPNDGDIAAAEMPIAINAGLPMLSPGLTNPGLTNASDSYNYGYYFSVMHPAGKPDTFFRLLATDDLQADEAANLLHAAGVTRVYVVDDGQPYGTSVGNYLTAAVVSAGETPAGRTSLPATTSANLTAAVTAITSANADGVFYAGSTAGAASLRQALAKPLPFVVMGGAFTDPTYLETAGTAAEDTLAVTSQPNVAGLQGSAATQFVNSYTQRFGSAPTSLAVSAYDAAQMVIGTIHSIIAKGAVPYRVSVLDQVASQRYSGVAGSYWFSSTGDNVLAGPISVYVVRGGSWQLAQSVQP
jgi:branched-chain amino acid transport system substrate-binding protein